MPAMHRSVVVALVALGCSTGQPDAAVDRETASVPAESAVATASSTPAPVDTAVIAPWYREGRALDLTADGVADSVLLVAVGERADSLRITLSFIVDGEALHRERWGSSYELEHLDVARRTPDRIDGVLRARLDSVLASVVVQRLDAPGVVIMEEDRAVLAGLDPRPTHRVSVSYGFETTVRLVWDAPRRRFVKLWSCC